MELIYSKSVEMALLLLLLFFFSFFFVFLFFSLFLQFIIFIFEIYTDQDTTQMNLRVALQITHTYKQKPELSMYTDHNSILVICRRFSNKALNKILFGNETSG